MFSLVLPPPVDPRRSPSTVGSGGVGRPWTLPPFPSVTPVGRGLECGVGLGSGVPCSWCRVPHGREGSLVRRNRSQGPVRRPPVPLEELLPVGKGESKYGVKGPWTTHRLPYGQPSTSHTSVLTMGVSVLCFCSSCFGHPTPCHSPGPTNDIPVRDRTPRVSD